MKKHLFQIILIPLILAGAWYGAQRILSIEPPKPAEEEAKEEAGKEGHVELTPEKLKEAALGFAETAPATITNLLPVYGKIVANEEAMAHVMARFPGVVKKVNKRLGDSVQKDEVLAVVESNESLRTYEVTAPASGTIIAKDAVPGEFVKDDMGLFTIADLSSVWVDLSVFRQDFKKLAVGAVVTLHIADEDEPLIAKVDYISPFGTEGTQTMLARCIVPNKSGDLRPGLFVTAEVATGKTEAAVSVKIGAIQTLHEKTVVFVKDEDDKDGDAFQAVEVKLGVKDGEHVEILEGLKPGVQYVAVNSFILKAEIGKSEAEEE